MRIILATLYILFGFEVSAGKLPKKLVFVNKTYKRDFQNSIRLFKSFVRYVSEQEIDFYFIVPDAESSEFQNKLAVFGRSERQRAKIITEGDLFKKCNVNLKKIKEMPGWEVQQVAKFCFAETDIAKNYFTMDSDIYFTREFKPYEVLFENGKPKIHGPKKSLKKNNLGKKLQFVRNCFKDTTKIYGNYIHGYEMWSSKLVREMKKHTLSQCGIGYVEMIKAFPGEMQWYGEYIRSRRPEYHQLMPPLFTLIGGEGSKVCEPDDGFPWSYGILYNNTQERYHNKCSKLQTFLKTNQKRVTRWIQLLKGYNV